MVESVIGLALVVGVHLRAALSLKNLVLSSAAVVIGTMVRGARLVQLLSIPAMRKR